MYGITSFYLLMQEFPILLSIVVVFFFIGLAYCRVFLYIASIFFLGLLFLFRNPMRDQYALSDGSALLSPVDGKVVYIAYDSKDNYQKIVIVVSFFDVYLTRMPYSAMVRKIHTANDVLEIDLVEQVHNKYLYTVRYVSNYCFQRAHCWVSVGKEVQTGDLCGIVPFGIRCELLLPKNVLIAVGLGQSVSAGVTPLGHWY